jgi:glucosamine-6-phosphate deaminase
MEVIIRPHAEDAAQLMAKLVARALHDQPDLVLGLATGRTMESVYSSLIRLYEAGECSFAEAQSFNLDEYIGLPASDRGSYSTFMQRHLFDKVNFKPGNTHIPDGMAKDLSEECRHYEEMIQDAGGIGLQLLGLGRDGHIGFNEPLSALLSRTRAKSLTPVTREQNAAQFGGADKVPTRAITIGVGTILESKRCLMLVTGKEKATILAKALEGPITSMISATALQLHPRCTVIVDEASAEKLERKDYYRWIFQNEPEWEEFRS